MFQKAQLNFSKSRLGSVNKSSGGPLWYFNLKLFNHTWIFLKLYCRVHCLVKSCIQLFCIHIQKRHISLAEKKIHRMLFIFILQSQKRPYLFSMKIFTYKSLHNVISKRYRFLFPLTNWKKSHNFPERWTYEHFKQPLMSLNSLDYSIIYVFEETTLMPNYQLR